MMNPKDPRRSRILIVDDHPIFREALRVLLTNTEAVDLEVVGEAVSGQQALELCCRLQPDLVLMDLRMPGMDGVEATRVIKRELPCIVVLMLTAVEHPKYLSEAIKAGASGYVLKEMSSPRIIDAIGRVLEGEFPINQELAMRLLQQLLDEAPKNEEEGEEKEHPEAALLGALSPREVEVLRLIARGQNNQQIAQNLLVSASTVKKHVKQIISKLGVSDRTQAAIKTIELGLLPE